MSDKQKMTIAYVFLALAFAGMLSGPITGNYSLAMPLFGIGAVGFYVFLLSTDAEKKRNARMRQKQEEFTDRIMDRIAPRKEEPKPSDNRDTYYISLNQKLDQLNEGLDSKKTTINQMADELFKDSAISKSRYLTATDNAAAIAKDNIRKCRTIAKGFGEYAAPTTEEKDTLESYVEKAERLSAMLNGIMNEFAKVDLADTSDKNVEDRNNDLKETTHLYTVG